MRSLDGVWIAGLAALAAQMPPTRRLCLSSLRHLPSRPSRLRLRLRPRRR